MDTILSALVDDEDFFGLCLVNQHFLPDNLFEDQIYCIAIDSALKIVRKHIADGYAKFEPQRQITLRIPTNARGFYPAKFLYGIDYANSFYILDKGFKKRIPGILNFKSLCPFLGIPELFVKFIYIFCFSTP